MTNTQHQNILQILGGSVLYLLTVLAKYISNTSIYILDFALTAGALPPSWCSLVLWASRYWLKGFWRAGPTLGTDLMSQTSTQKTHKKRGRKNSKSLTLKSTFTSPKLKPHTEKSFPRRASFVSLNSTNSPHWATSIPVRAAAGHLLHEGLVLILHLLYLFLLSRSREEWTSNSSILLLYCSALYRRLCQPLQSGSESPWCHHLYHHCCLLGGRTANQGVLMSLLGSVDRLTRWRGLGLGGWANHNCCHFINLCHRETLVMQFYHLVRSRTV